MTIKILKYKLCSCEILLILAGYILINSSLFAQELEPRFLSPAPVGMNFVIVAYSYSEGNVLLDQSLPLENTDSRSHAITPAYVRSINFFGLSGRLSATLPVAKATWQGKLDSTDETTSRTGLGDPLIVLEANFIGIPPSKGKEFLSYKNKTTLGASFKLSVPIGQYNSDKFFNISTHRWRIGLQLGLAHRISRFIFETYLSSWFFTTNTNFFGGNTLSQEPLFAAQLHASYIFSPGFWAAVSFGQNYGGATVLNDESKAPVQKNNRWEFTVAIPLSTEFSFKLAFASGITTRFGANFTTFAAAVQYRWGGL